MVSITFLTCAHGELHISGCPEVVGMKKSNKNCHQRNR